MIILALDCSLDSCSAAVFDDARGILAERFERMERGQAEAIAPMARDVMAEARLGFEQIARIGVTLGPGTFTGIRIGLACAKGLALALDKPVIGIDTLRAIAVNAGQASETIAVATDARQGQIYLGLYRGGKTHMAPRRIALEDASYFLPAGPLAILGGAKAALIAAADRDDLAPRTESDIPVAAKFAPLIIAAEPDAMRLRPLYLAESYAKRPRAKVEIVLARGDDAVRLSQLHGACFEMTWSATDIARLLAMPGAFCLIAEQKGEVLGFLLLRIAGDEAEIISIATRPDSRRQGIGAKLIDAAVELLGTQKTTRLLIEVADSNDAALALYRKFGFATVGRRRDYYQHADGRREDAAIMRKEIPA
ncbi:MAG: tRNA (adenosine(37)-N6)-threonylcarbamoyltransferase complex dimerization subunit type 1 TsaB [Rhizobiales bacterium]|nr:tRNA (adenosine(37)-N6)-threonylcarbamoyltransferase complex dimerization subunit type 1 TsaB [Hyphomicrobiales bacterium]